MPRNLNEIVHSKILLQAAEQIVWVCFFTRMSSSTVPERSLIFAIEAWATLWFSLVTIISEILLSFYRIRIGWNGKSIIIATASSIGMTCQCGSNFYDNVRCFLHLMESICVFNTRMRWFFVQYSDPQYISLRSSTSWRAWTSRNQTMRMRFMSSASSRFNNCSKYLPCLLVLRIRDIYLGSWFFPSRIPDQTTKGGVKNK